MQFVSLDCKENRCLLVSVFGKYYLTESKLNLFYYIYLVFVFVCVRVSEFAHFMVQLWSLEENLWELVLYFSLYFKMWSCVPNSGC